jgi:hypothetical protein
MLLCLRTAFQQGPGEDLGSGDQRPADPERGATELFRGDDHRDVLAVTALAVAAVLGRHAESEHAQLGKTGDQLLGHVAVAPMHVFGDRSDLLVSERAEGVLHHLRLAVEMTGPGPLGERGDERRAAIDLEESGDAAERIAVEPPQTVPPGEARAEVVEHVGDERACQSRLEVALRAVVEHRTRRCDLGGDLGEVVRQHLLGVGPARTGELHGGAPDNCGGHVHCVRRCDQVGLLLLHRSRGYDASPAPRK